MITRITIACAPPDYDTPAICGDCSGFGCGDCAGTGLAPRTRQTNAEIDGLREPTCCDLACYEDPGCLCDGCSETGVRDVPESGSGVVGTVTDNAASGQRIDQIGTPPPDNRTGPTTPTLAAYEEARK